MPVEVGQRRGRRGHYLEIHSAYLASSESGNPPLIARVPAALNAGKARPREETES